MKDKIDLTKSQRVLEDVKVRVWDEHKIHAIKGYLADINHKTNYPFGIWIGGRRGKDFNFKVTWVVISCYKNCELIPEPEYMTPDEIEGFCEKYEPHVRDTRYDKGFFSHYLNFTTGLLKKEDIPYLEYAIPIEGEVFEIKKFLKGGTE